MKADYKLVPPARRREKLGKLAFLGGSRPPDPLDLAPPAPIGVPKWGGAADFGRRPVPCWRQRRQVRGFWGAGASQEGQPPGIMLPSCAGGWVLPALPQVEIIPSLLIHKH